MIRTTLKVDAQSYALAQGQDIAGIKRAAKDAARSGGDLIEVLVAGNQKLSVLITPGFPVMFEEQDVPQDERDASDTGSPFASDFDFDF